MKMLSLVSAMVLAATVFTISARAEEPPAPSALKLTPQMQAMLAELLKAADPDSAPEVAPSAPSPTTEKPIVHSKPTALGSSSLKTSSLVTSSLGGHGALGSVPRLTKEEWRELFPARK